MHFSMHPSKNFLYSKLTGTEGYHFSPHIMTIDVPCIWYEKWMNKDTAASKWGQPQKGRQPQNRWWAKNWKCALSINWGPPIYNTLNIQIRHFYVSTELLFKNNKDSIQMQKNYCWKLLNYFVLCCMIVILASTYHYSLLLQFKEKQLAGAKLWKLCQLNTFSGKLEIFAKFF